MKKSENMAIILIGLLIIIPIIPLLYIDNLYYRVFVLIYSTVLSMRLTAIAFRLMN